MAHVGTEGRADTSGTRGLKARDDVVSRQVDDEWVLYDPVSQKMHVLNLTAAIIWNFLDGTRTLDDLVSDTSEAFDPPPPVNVLTQDVGTVLDQLAAEGLLA